MVSMLPPDLAVVLVRTAGPVNLGMISRCCANLGISDLRLVDPQCDREHLDARRFANKSQDLLQSAGMFADLGAALGDRRLVVGTSARPRDSRARPLTLGQLPAALGPAGALVFGNEAHGLDAGELGQCDALLTLDTPGPYPSYNLSHAVAITLGYLQHARPPEAATEEPPLATVARRQELETYWLATLQRFDHFRKIGGDKGAAELREMLQGLPLADRDCIRLRGMLAQFNYVAFGDKQPDQAHSS
jgi:tRNA/rRNA methyltransferase